MSKPERVVAAGGTVRVVNGCSVEKGRVAGVGLPRSLLARFQVIEYLRAFLMGRLGWSTLKTLPLIAGAFGVFRRNAAIAVGGYDTGTVGEDYELIIRMHRHMLDAGADYEICFVPEPVCWTQVPTDLGSLARQRIRWQRGALETFFKHLSMLFKPRYGRVGVLSLGHSLIVDVLGPPAEVAGYLLVVPFWVAGALDSQYALAFLSLVFVYGVFVSLGALVLEELELKRFPRLRHLLILSAVAVFENFGYRQLNNVFRVLGWAQFLRRRKGDWGRVRREAFDGRAGSRVREAGSTL